MYTPRSSTPTHPDYLHPDLPSHPHPDLHPDLHRVTHTQIYTHTEPGLTTPACVPLTLTLTPTLTVPGGAYASDGRRPRGVDAALAFGHDGLFNEEFGPVGGDVGRSDGGNEQSDQVPQDADLLPDANGRLSSEATGGECRAKGEGGRFITRGGRELL